MTKLFADDELDIEVSGSKRTTEDKIEDSDIPDINEVYGDALKVSVEAVHRASNDLFTVGQLKASLESKKLSSVEYFTSIENYNLCMRSISNNLGISFRIPSMEDFKNPYGTKASHQFVMEGFVKFMRSIWEKIKSFFKEFFKKIMLFFKRLVKANLEMEEYEEYIESLMQTVKRSNKKDVPKIKVDSKLPTLLSEFGMQTMTIEYLLTKGRHKIENINRLNTFISDRCLPDLEKSVKAHVNKIKETFKKPYIPSPGQARDKASEFRHDFIEAFTKDLFNFSVQEKNLPEEVYSTVMYNFDKDQLSDNKTQFFSLVNDNDGNYVLPNNFNLYFANSRYGDSSDINDTPTNKLLIIPHIQKNTHIENHMYIISNRENLLKFYEFYKSFSKSFNITRIDKRMDSFDTTISNITSSLKDPFAYVTNIDYNDMEANFKPSDNQQTNSDANPSPSSDVNTQSNLDIKPHPKPPEDTIRFVERPTDGSANWVEALYAERSMQEAALSNMMGDLPVVNISSINPATENNSPIFSAETRQTRKEFEHLERFMMNYMHCIQSLLKEYSVNIASTGQECRYEMIKILYKSAKQFE